MPRSLSRRPNRGPSVMSNLQKRNGKLSAGVLEATREGGWFGQPEGEIGESEREKEMGERDLSFN